VTIRGKIRSVQGWAFRTLSNPEVEAIRVYLAGGTEPQSGKFDQRERNDR